MFRNRDLRTRGAVSLLMLVWLFVLLPYGCAPGSQQGQDAPSPEKQQQQVGDADRAPHPGTGVTLTHKLEYEANGSIRTGQLLYQDRNYPEGSFTVLILLHDEFGVDDWLYSRAEEYTEMGYVVVCPNLSGLGGHEARDRQVLDNIEAALVASSTVIPGCDTSTDRAVIGWDIGGTYALTCARYMDLRGAVICYGQLITNAEGLLGVREPLLGIYGMDDPNTSMDTLEEFRETLARMGGQYKAIVWRDEGRLFLRHPRDPARARDAEFEITSWLHKYCTPNQG
ncbi:MAG: hypothetical protein HND57_10525 [Planctomycetes bacterium]|nr:hypothetical protein [Planctomycetota bacterium]